MKVIELHRSITASNDADAARLREELRKEGTLLINLMSSPGSGKTTLLKRTVSDLAKQEDGLSIGVLEADIASDVDAVAMEAVGAKSIQAHTDGMCHVDAGMTRAALESLSGETDRTPDLIFLENVGNLICPAEFDTGAALNVMILSVPEGDDKPLKYPLMFQKSDALLITKTDTLDWFDFNMEKAVSRAKALHPDLAVFPVSAKTGEGMDAWEDWLLAHLRQWKEPAHA